MLTTTYEMLQKAYEGHYAVPAINTQGGTYDIIRAVCMAASKPTSWLSSKSHILFHLTHILGP